MLCYLWVFLQLILRKPFVPRLQSFRDSTFTCFQLNSNFAAFFWAPLMDSALGIEFVFLPLCLSLCLLDCPQAGLSTYLPVCVIVCRSVDGPVFYLFFFFAERAISFDWVKLKVTDPELTLSAPISQNGQTHSNNSSAICRRIVWVCLAILWDWRLKA